MNQLQQKKDIEWIDNLRVIATISVVVIHVISAYLKFETQPTTNWWVANVFDSLLRFCVPIFVMITGALLLPKEYQLYDYLKNRILRIIIPFVFWTFIYIILNYILLILSGNSLSFNFVLKDIAQKIINGASFHFWYIYMIIGIYLFIPIIGKWVRNCDEKEIVYFLGIWLLITIWNQPFCLKVLPKLELPYFTGYIGYLVLGYYLSIKNFDYIKPQYLIVLFFLAGSITAIGTYYFSARDEGFNEEFYAFLTPNVLMSTIAVFLFFNNLSIKNKLVKKIFSFINNLSFGIYFVHILVIILFNKIGLNCMIINPIIGIPLVSILCLFSSSLIIYFLKKLPYLRKLVG